jgi:uncharacterized protein YukE
MAILHRLVSQLRPTSHTMNENHPPSDDPEVAPTDPHPPPSESGAESSPPPPPSAPPPQDQCPSTTNTPKDPERKEEVREERKEEKKGDTTRFGEGWRLRREIASLSGQLEKQKAEVSKLREAEEKLRGKVERRENTISQLDHDLEKMRHSWNEAEKVHARQAQGMQERLKRTEELLATRSAELSGAQAFLSTADRLSEMEVLGIVRELNENIYQVAAGLTEGWMKMESSKPPEKVELDLTSQQRSVVLVQLARNRDLTGLTFLIQLHLCYYATNMTSSWAHNKDFVLVKELYQRLSASGEYQIIDAKWYATYVCTIEGQAVSARWRSLTHTHLSVPPPNAEWLADQLARVINETGSFESSEQLAKFVQTAALERIEEMIRTTRRLEKVFMVDVTSSDMSLIFHNPDVLFDGAKMINEFGADSAAEPGKPERIAGTTEVGVQKTVCKKPGEPRHVEILLKPKVVLEKDVVGDGK